MNSMNLGTVDFRNVEDLSENKYIKAGRYTAYVTEAEGSTDGSGQPQIKVTFKNSNDETINHWFSLSTLENRKYGLQLTKKFLTDAGNDMSNFSGQITSEMIIKRPVIIVVGYKDPTPEGKFYTRIIATEPVEDNTPVFEIDETEEARIKHLRKHLKEQQTAGQFGGNGFSNQGNDFSQQSNDFSFENDNSFDISEQDLPF